MRVRNTILKIVALITILVMALYIAYLKIANPDMTDMRFFIEYWRVVMVILVISIPCSVVLMSSKLRG